MTISFEMCTYLLCFHSGKQKSHWRSKLGDQIWLNFPFLKFFCYFFIKKKNLNEKKIICHEKITQNKSFSLFPYIKEKFGVTFLYFFFFFLYIFAQKIHLSLLALMLRITSTLCIFPFYSIYLKSFYYSHKQTKKKTFNIRST